MIDVNARRTLAENQKTKTLVEGMKASIVEVVKGMKPDNKVDELKSSMDSQMKEMQSKTESMIEGIKTTLGETLAKNQDLQNVAKMPLEDVFKNLVKEEGNKKLLEQLVSIDATSGKSAEKLGKIGNALAMLYEIVKKPFQFPSIFKVQGKVEVSNSLKITNLSELDKNFKSLEAMLRTFAQAASMAPAPQIKIPDFPKIQIPKLDTSKLEEMIQELIEKTGKPSKGNSDSMIAVLNRVKDSIDELVQKPVYIPQPATNVQINPLQGVAKTTAVTVGTGLTQLPDYGQLNNRRSLIIFNNSSSVTIYIGGSDLTSSNGLPVPAQTYSPPIDAGYNMVIYGRTASSTADVRVMEVSKDLTNNIQQ